MAAKNTYGNALAAVGLLLVAFVGAAAWAFFKHQNANDESTKAAKELRALEQNLMAQQTSLSNIRKESEEHLDFSNAWEAYFAQKEAAQVLSVISEAARSAGVAVSGTPRVEQQSQYPFQAHQSEVLVVTPEVTGDFAKCYNFVSTVRKRLPHMRIQSVTIRSGTGLVLSAFKVGIVIPVQLAATANANDAAK